MNNLFAIVPVILTRASERKIFTGDAGSEPAQTDGRPQGGSERFAVWEGQVSF